jgi:glutamate racemase
MAKKSKDEIIALSMKNTDLLLKWIASSLSVQYCDNKCYSRTKKKYDIPFIGIRPAIKPAATNSKNTNDRHSSHTGNSYQWTFQQNGTTVPKH